MSPPLKFERADPEAGVSLTETMLVLAVSSGLIVMSMRMYYQWSEYTNARNLYANVEQLQAAMRNYYHANCRATSSGSGGYYSPGTLDASRYSNLTISMTVNSAASAFDLGYTGFLTSWHPANPLVDSSYGPDQGYYVQFVRILNAANSDFTMSVSACPGSSSGPTDCAGATQTQLYSSSNAPPLRSTVVHWMSQVTVKIADDDLVSTLGQQLGATCITTSPTATCQSGAYIMLSSAASSQGIISSAYALPAPTPPSPAPTPPPPSPTPPPPSPPTYYLVWEIPVTRLMPDTTSTLWPTIAQVQQFNMQYTNDGMSALSGIASSSSFYDIKYYLCGD